MCGDRDSATKLLLRVRRRKKKISEDGQRGTSSGDTDEQEYEYDGRILGVIDEAYTFDSEFHRCLPRDLPSFAVYSEQDQRLNLCCVLILN